MYQVLINFGLTKGQIISKGNFGAFKSLKIVNQMFSRISALASKMCEIKEIKALYQIK